MKSCLLYTLAQPNKQDPSNRNNFKMYTENLCCYLTLTNVNEHVQN